MSQDVNRLKELLFENESRALADLNRRMDIVFDRAGSTERFTASVAAVLDQALAQAEIEKHSEVSHAIAPLIVQTIKTEIRGSQDELAEALYPSLGRMVKAYVVSAIRDLMDEINRRLESNAFMLRLRSILTGRPVAELAFVEGQRLKVEEIFLIRRGLGELLAHWPSINGPTAQDQRVSGILTAINEVATEAFDADKAALRRIDLGTSLIYLRASPTHLLAAKCRGVAPAAVEQRHRREVPGDDRAAARAVQWRNRRQCAGPGVEQLARRSFGHARELHCRATHQAHAPPYGLVAGHRPRLGHRPGAGGVARLERLCRLPDGTRARDRVPRAGGRARARWLSGARHSRTAWPQRHPGWACPHHRSGLGRPAQPARRPARLRRRQPHDRPTDPRPRRGPRRHRGAAGRASACAHGERKGRDSPRATRGGSRDDV